MAKRNFYEILGVSRTATAEEIKAAYRELSKRYHPDKTGGDPIAQEEQKLINVAWNCLRDPEFRKKYDEQLLTPNLSGEDLEELHRRFYDLFASIVSKDKVRTIEIIEGFALNPTVKDLGRQIWSGLKRKWFGTDKT